MNWKVKKLAFKLSTLESSGLINSKTFFLHLWQEGGFFCEVECDALPALSTIEVSLIEVNKVLSNERLETPPCPPSRGGNAFRQWGFANQQIREFA